MSCSARSRTFEAMGSTRRITTSDRLKTLREELATHPDVGREVDLDILLTDALARLAYNAFYGKGRPGTNRPQHQHHPDLDGRKRGGEGSRVSGEQIALPADRGAEASAPQVRSAPQGACQISPIRRSRRLGENSQGQGAFGGAERPASARDSASPRRDRGLAGTTGQRRQALRRRPREGRAPFSEATPPAPPETWARRRSSR